MKLEALYKRYHLHFDPNEVKQVLTHNSFSEKNNSRYVFHGMFTFKGRVADWVFKYIKGTGPQLQHYLGNVFSQKNLIHFFDKHIGQIDRISAEVNVESQKHIFSYAVFGHITTLANESQLTEFILNHIINPNDHILPEVHKPKSLWDELIFLCKQNFDSKPKLQHKIEDKLQHVSVVLENEIIGQHQSVSYKYAKKKAITLALKKVAAQLEAELIKTMSHQQLEKHLAEKEQKKIEALKAAKQEKHIKRIETHSTKMSERKIELKRQAQEADRKRRMVKQEVKEKKSRKGANSIYREYTIEEIKAMSVAKRRNLQDRGIIPQGSF